MLYYLYFEPGQAKILKRFIVDKLALINLEAGEQSRSMHFWLGEEGNNHQPSTWLGSDGDPN